MYRKFAAKWEPLFSSAGNSVNKTQSSLTVNMLQC